MIELIKLILEEITHFSFVILIIAFIFGTCFMLMAQNILDFDNDPGSKYYLSDNNIDMPFRTLYGAMWYIYLMCLGWFTFNGFDKPDNEG